MTSPLRSFLDRISRAARAPDPEAELEDSGLEVWEGPSSITDATMREGIADPRAGAVLRTLSFPTSFEPPGEYPEGWPFLAGVDAHFGEAIADDAEARFLIWTDPGDLDRTAERVRDALGSDGWRHHAIAGSSTDAGGTTRTHLAWFMRAGRYRLLSIVRHQELTGLVLTEAPYDQLWPGEEARPPLAD